MKKTTSFVIRMVVIILASAVAGMQAIAQQNYVGGELIVQMQYQKEVDKMMEEINASHPNMQLTIKRELSERLSIYLMQFDHNAVTDIEAMAAVNYHKDVALVQYNHTDVVQRDTILNDPRFADQWCHHNDGVNSSGGGGADMASCDAWAITTGGMTVTNEQLVVAVIDGGFDLNHEDLNFYTNPLEIPGDNLDNDSNGYVDDVSGWDAVDNNGDVMFNGFWDSHGTHVAGIVGALGNNNAGVVGVNHNVQIMPITGSSGNEATVVAAYAYVLDQRLLYNQTGGAQGAFVVSTNSSFGVDNADPTAYPIWCAMYDSLGAAGILSATATTNANTDVDLDGDVPTACSSPYMISVTNTNAGDTRNGSGYGLTTIDMGSPGTDILSTYPNDAYSAQTGTSMATPQVAGAIALMWSAACPTMIADYHNDPAGLAMEMRNLLLSNGLAPAPSLTTETVTGGRLDLERAVVATGLYAGCPLLSIQEDENTAFDLSVAPNPNNGRFTLSVQTVAYGSYDVYVMDVLGKVVTQQQLEVKGEQQVDIDLGNVDTGIYFVRIQNEKGRAATVKMLVE